MNFKVGDDVLVSKDAPLEERDLPFTKVLSKVLAINEDKVILGIYDRALVVPAKYCIPHIDNRKRLKLFKHDLCQFLANHGAKMYPNKGTFGVTFDEGKTFHNIKDVNFEL